MTSQTPYVSALQKLLLFNSTRIRAGTYEECRNAMERKGDIFPEMLCSTTIRAGWDK